MALIHLDTRTSGETPEIRKDMQRIQDAINLQQSILDLESRTADPTLGDTTGKIQVWYRRDLQQIRFNDNGTTYKIQAVAA